MTTRLPFRCFQAGAGALLLAVLLGACADHSIDASDFDQSCKAASDCVPVFSGTLSCDCADLCTENAAINKSAAVAYNMEANARRPSCSGDNTCVAHACTPTAVACVAGKCTVAN